MVASETDLTKGGESLLGGAAFVAFAGEGCGTFGDVEEGNGLDGGGTMLEGVEGFKGGEEGFGGVKLEEDGSIFENVVVVKGIDAGFAGEDCGTFGDVEGNDGLGGGAMLESVVGFEGGGMESGGLALKLGSVADFKGGGNVFGLDGGGIFDKLGLVDGALCCCVKLGKSDCDGIIETGLAAGASGLAGVSLGCIKVSSSDCVGSIELGLEFKLGLEDGGVNIGLEAGGAKLGLEAGGESGRDLVGFAGTVHIVAL